MHGVDRFRDALAGIERVFARRVELSSSGAAALASPWIVPRLQRRHESYEDIDGTIKTISDLGEAAATSVRS
jgi:hypothetical protein